MAEVIELQKLKVGGALNVYLLHILGAFIIKYCVLTVVSDNTRARAYG